MPALTLQTACVLFLLAAAALAEDEAKTSPLTRTLNEAVEWFEVETVEPDPQKLTPVKALAWNNEDRTASSQGLTVLYVTGGRPYATVCIFRWEEYINHHFGSLTSSKLAAKDSRSGQVIWSPTSPGLEWKRRIDAEAPHTSPARRLRQMKAIAEQFTVNMTGWKPDNTDKQKLRLLPKPIYRYETNQAQEDGAVFAFVTGVDPEALLLIESRSSEGKLHWEFAFARRTSGGLEAYDDENLVWSAQKGPVETDPNGIYRATGRKLPPERLKVQGEE